MTVQPSIGAIPITALDPPPEGLQSANFAVTLTQLQPNYAASLQLNSQGGIALSQVVSLYVDNQLNPVPITLVHGALNEVTIVAAGAAAVIPTMSNGGYYLLNASVPAAEISPITGAVTFNIVLSNYMRHKATFSTVVSQSIAGDTYNTQVVLSTIVTIPPGAFGPVLIFFGSSFIYDSLDIALEAIEPSAAGPINIGWELAGFVDTAPSYPRIASGSIVFNAISTAWVAGAAITKPVRRTWYPGLTPDSFGELWLNFIPDPGPTANITTGFMRVNISGAQVQL